MESSTHMAVFWANGPHVGPCFLSGAAPDGCPPDNPTRQLLPIRKEKGGGGGPRSKTKLCVTKLYVKDGV